MSRMIYSNTLVESLCKKHDIDDRFKNLFLTHHSTLPTMYTLIKTHKFSPDEDISGILVADLKVRPIVSCTNGPTEKVAWLVTHLLKPLLNHVPVHLANIHVHLQKLAEIPPEKRRGQKFFSADISALYTNLSPQDCIDSVMEMTEEYWEDIRAASVLHFDQNDIRQMLQLVLGESYFTFNMRLFYQILGLFMGCAPSPILAIVRVWKFENNSIFIDIRFITNFYGRYIDDGARLAKSKDDAILFTNSIADQDPSGRLKWEVDFPKDADSYVPFLDTEIKLDEDGNLHSRFYRKPQKKKITTHWRSHHPLSTKEEVARNFYRTARDVSNNELNTEYSVNIVTDLLRHNGFDDPSKYDCPKVNVKSKKKKENFVMLTLPYLNESVSNKIKNHIRKLKLPIRVVFKPGTKLRNVFTNSRPFDKVRCPVGHNCKICPHMEQPGCSQPNCVYLVKCKLCSEEYTGEAGRPLHDRLMEHRRAGFNPPSYPDNAISKHYLEHHIDSAPDLEYTILDVQPNTVRRKISEAACIFNRSSGMNDRNELQSLKKFLV